MQLLWLSGAAAGALALAALPTAPANGTDRVFHDAAGRSIHFTTRVGDAPLARYARVLSQAIHGDEIERLTIEVVAPADVPRLCATPKAVACHIHGGDARPRIVIAPGPRTERLLLHEYGHHLDIHLANGVRSEPNGTPRWWAARRIGAGIRAGHLTRDYEAGWHGAVPELFAEDYARLNGGSGWMVRSVPASSRPVLRALRRDLAAALRSRAPAPRRGGRILSRRGLLTRADRQFVLFRTGTSPELATGTFAIRRGGGSGVRFRLVCDGRRLRDAARDTAGPIRLARRLPANAECRAVIEGGPAVYSLVMRRTRTL